MIILCGAPKGGTGKTTCATNIAARRQLDGRDVLILDTDVQATANHWATLREAEGSMPPIPVVQQFGDSVRRAVADLRKRYDDIVIDAGGRDSVELRHAMLVADLAITPICASQFDVWTLARMAQLADDVADLRNGGPLRISVICNRASTNPRVNEVQQASEAVAEFEDLRYAGAICERIAYRRAARSGLSIFEDPTRDLVATQEFDRVYRDAIDG